MQVPALSRVAHLVRRFFQVLFARPLTAAESAHVAAVLDGSRRSLFDAQDVADQRHAIAVFHRVAAATADVTAREAALLHDIGKTGLGLGAMRRTVVTVAGAAHLPMTSRMRAYLDHGRVGAARLAAAGCAPLVIDFARRHP
ncbi:MAG: hypothetical protein M3349_06165, partial [Actinomycetota bacterium]|nr:hypothetical protein [Actinomycetota bacterium]